MPTYRVTMVVGKAGLAGTGTVRTVTTNFAGCSDEDDAKRKAREVYDVVAFKKVELAKEKGK